MALFNRREYLTEKGRKKRDRRNRNRAQKVARNIRDYQKRGGVNAGGDTPSRRVGRPADYDKIRRLDY